MFITFLESNDNKKISFFNFLVCITASCVPRRKNIRLFNLSHLYNSLLFVFFAEKGWFWMLKVLIICIYKANSMNSKFVANMR